MIKRALALALVLPLAACATAPGSQAPSYITVFAAASLQPPFDAIKRQLQSSSNLAITYNYAGTQTLTSQLSQGARADVFASADEAHMVPLENASLIAGEPKVFVHNRLEIAVERGNPKGIHSLADLARAGIVVVLADPSVPAGKYAQVALAKAKVKVHPASLEPQVTGVLSKVALGEADAGIVYVSDITTSGRVEGVPIPDDQNVVADYLIAELSSAANREGANQFIAYVLSSSGQSALATAGFEKA